MQEFIYSIIIPHHNIPKLLERCLNSIPKRNDTQILVIDDHSDKISLQELSVLQNKFDYVHFVFLNDSRHGGGHARNIGLQHATGKYILFADADDFFTYCFNDILNTYQTVETDAVFFNANAVHSDLYTHCKRTEHLNKIFDLYKTNPQAAELDFRYAFGEPWCKLVRRKIIETNQIQFEETLIHNDTQYSYLIGFYCKNILIDNHAIYCVTEREDSVSKQISSEKWLQRTAVFAKANHFFATHKINRFDDRVFAALYHFKKIKDRENETHCLKILNQFNISLTAWRNYFTKRKIKNVKKKFLNFLH